MENRCINDIFAYCTGKPKPQTKEETIIISGQPSDKEKKEGLVSPEGYRLRKDSLTVCSLDKETCGKYLKESERR